MLSSSPESTLNALPTFEFTHAGDRGFLGRGGELRAIVGVGAFSLDGGVVVHGLAEGDGLVPFWGFVLAAVGQARAQVISECLRDHHLASLSELQPAGCYVFGLLAEGAGLRLRVGGGSGMIRGWP